MSAKPGQSTNQILPFSGEHRQAGANMRVDAHVLQGRAPSFHSLSASYVRFDALRSVGGSAGAGETIMAEMTREEADAKIGQTEARLEARVAEVRGDIKVISHKIDTLVSEVSASRVDRKSVV